MGEEKHDGLAIPGTVVLAHEAPFAIGGLRVDPATRQVERGGKRETLEPRVMQVFVALARANGGIVTRDELTEWCWGGRIVGEDSINRAIFRLRQVASEIGGGAFAVETITKVGYRLVRTLVAAEPEVAERSPARSVTSRRGLVAAAAASVAGLATAGILWFKPWRHRPDPEAVELVRRGDMAQRAGYADQSRQAVTYFEKAVQVDPQYAAAWGMLALAYTHNLDGYGEAQFASLPGRIRSAAARALELDPDNPDAQLALACTRPYFRNWAQLEPELRRIRDRYPRHWLANGRLAILLYQVGRLVEGAELHKGVIAFDPMIAPTYALAATALSNAGRIQEADAIFKEAHDRWPAHPWLWSSRYQHLLFSGRPASAAAFIMDPESLPSGFGKPEVDPLLLLARAVEKGEASDIAASIEFGLDLVKSDIRNAPDSVSVFALLGRMDLVWPCLERYFLNAGTFGTSSPIGPYTRRYTDFLYTMPMAQVRSDPRFVELIRAIGLETYWRSSGRRPDVA
jgi:DNA-binding winged helix-turn-helix (wHTH) protein/tetratricopeptide (TPR) repeat protein